MDKKIEFSELTEDDPIIFEDGRSLTFEIVPDEGVSIDDYDCYGRIVRTGHDASRPKDFDGNAEIIDRNRWEVAWWQPPNDIKRGDANFSRLRSIVEDILGYGFVGYVVSLKCPHGGVIDQEGLWAMEPFLSHELESEIVAELASVLMDRVSKEECCHG